MGLQADRARTLMEYLEAEARAGYDPNIYDFMERLECNAPAAAIAVRMARKALREEGKRAAIVCDNRARPPIYRLTAEWINDDRPAIKPYLDSRSGSVLSQIRTMVEAARRAQAGVDGRSVEGREIRVSLAFLEPLENQLSLMRDDDRIGFESRNGVLSS